MPGGRSLSKSLSPTSPTSSRNFRSTTLPCNVAVLPVSHCRGHLTSAERDGNDKQGEKGCPFGLTRIELPNPRRPKLTTSETCSGQGFVSVRFTETSLHCVATEAVTSLRQAETAIPLGGSGPTASNKFGYVA